MVKHAEIIDRIIKAGTLFHSATGVDCIVADIVNHRLTAIPDASFNHCLCPIIGDELYRKSTLDHIFSFSQEPINNQSLHVYHCRYGLANIIVPVYRGEAVVAALLAGPILDVEPESLLQSNNILDANEALRDEILKALSNTPRQTVNQIIALSEMLQWMTPQYFSEEREEEPVYSGIVQMALDYIHTHYNNKIRLTDTAQATFVNPAYLSRLFSKEVKASFTTYLNHYRIDKSKELLQDRELSIMNVCSLVGFKNQSYYNKIFKQCVGRTPGQFKSEHASC